MLRMLPGPVRSLRGLVRREVAQEWKAECCGYFQRAGVVFCRFDSVFWTFKGLWAKVRVPLLVRVFICVDFFYAHVRSSTRQQHL